MKNKITDKLVVEQVNKHKKALFFVFFDTEEDLQIKELVADSGRGNKVRDIVVFENDQKVIYENAPADLEQGMKKYLSWLNQNVMREKKMYCRSILEYPECSFFEYIPYQKCETMQQKKDYYYRAGSLIALILTLGGDILLMSDVVEMGEYPVINDMTVLLKNVVAFNENIVEYQALAKQKKWNCEQSEDKELERGYNAVYHFVQENKEDVNAAIQFCFQKYNERRKLC